MGCFGGNASVPPMPGPTAEETALEKAQLEAYNTYMQSSKDQMAQNKEMSDVYKQTSGLYKPVDVTTGDSYKWSVDSGKVEGLKSALKANVQASIGSIVGDNVAQDLQRRGIDTSKSVQSLYGTNSDVFGAIDSMAKDNAGDPNALQYYGIGQSALDKKGGTSTEWQLNKDAVDAYAAKQKALQDQQDRISSLELDRYEKALSGQLPVSSATLQEEGRGFSAAKEALTSRGANITGDSWQTATGSDSASIENLNRLRQTYQVSNEAEQQGILNSMQGYRNAASTTDYLSQATGAYGPGAGSAAIGNGVSLASSAMQPYYNQRMMGYNTQVTNAQLQSQQQAAIYGLIGQGIGAGGSAAILKYSSRDFKKDIIEMTPEDEEGALSSLRKPKTYRYRYKWEDEKAPETTGFMAEEAPDTMRRGRMIDLGENISLLTSAVRALDRKMTKYEEAA